MKFSTVASLLFSLLVSGAIAAPISHEDIVSKTASGLRLISIQDGVEPVWKTEKEVFELIKSNAHFLDVTDTYEADAAVIAASKKVAALKTSDAERATFPAPSKQTQVKAILSTLTVASMQSYMTTLTSYNNRYYTASTGVSASTWLYNTLTSIASGSSGITITQFTHSFSQKSVIARFNGNGSGPITILGAHLDTINQSSPSSGRAPGADDDGTGVVNLLEAFKGLVKAGFKPTTPLEFHFYAGEEAGLLGSQAIASNYVNSGKTIKAYMNLDMTGYFKPGTKEVIAVVTDYVDSGLNTFLKQLITAYNSLPAGVDSCGYACSDHVPWYRLGVPTTYPFEAPTADSNPYVHTSSDTTSVSGFSWTHTLEFAKLAAAFAYELSA